MQKVYTTFYDADVASLVYWMQFTGPLKIMLDRLLTAIVNDELKKDLTSIMTAGSP